MFSAKRHPSRHIADDALVQYLDGELPPSQMSEIQQHLAICWSCRGRAGEFKQSIRLFLQYRKATIQQLGGPPHQFGGFRERLRQQALEMTAQAVRTETRHSPSWLARVGDSLGQITMPRAATAAVASIALVYWFFFSGASLSAQVVLRQAVLSESAELGRFSRPVVHQRLRISLERRQAVCEIWRAPKERKIRQDWRGGDNLADELTAVLVANHFDSEQPLSVAGFAAWRESLGEKRENVRTDERAQTVEVATEAPRADAGRIKRVVFTLRASDWHPISQALEVPTASGGMLRYRVEETSFGVVPIEQVSASVFAAVQPAVAHALAPAVSVNEIATEVPAPAGIGEEQIAESEVLLSEALHATGADTREAPEVRRTGDHIDLSLWSDDELRKQQILASIEQIPAVVPHLNGEGEQTAPLVARGVPRQAAPETYATQPPLAKALKEYAGSAEAATNLLAVVSDASQELRATTAALNRLAVEYPDERWRALPAPLRLRLDRIASDHVALIRRRADEYLALLSPALDAMAKREGLAAAIIEPVNGTGSWRSVACELNDAVPRLQTPFRRLFMEDHVDVPREAFSAHDLLSETVAARARLRAALDRLKTP